MEWGTYKLWDLFDIQNTLSFNKNRLVSWNKYDYITRTSQNQWILLETWFVNRENINPDGIWSLWLLQMDFFYRHKPWYAWQFIRKIIPKIDISQESKLFFTIILNLQKKKLLSVLVRDVDEIFKDLEVQLPIKNWKIDFKFMESFIEELENEKMNKLNNYLDVTWLKDYNLTEKENKVLEDYESGKFEWWEFIISDLFKKLSSKYRWEWDKFKNVSKIKTDIYCIPLIYAKSWDNWIMYWWQKWDFETHNNIISVIYNWAIAAGLVYAQLEETWVLAESYFIKLKDYNASFKVNLFLQKALEKVLYSKYSREYLATWTNKVENDKIQLPAKNNEPDYELMETLISAVKKNVIKDVVNYTDNKMN